MIEDNGKVWIDISFETLCNGNDLTARIYFARALDEMSKVTGVKLQRHDYTFHGSHGRSSDSSEFRITKQNAIEYMKTKKDE